MKERMKKGMKEGMKKGIGPICMIWPAPFYLVELLTIHQRDSRPRQVGESGACPHTGVCPHVSVYYNKALPGE